MSKVKKKTKKQDIDISSFLPEEKLLHHIKNNAKRNVLDELFEENPDIDINHLIFEEEKLSTPTDSLLSTAVKLENLDIIEWLLVNGADKFMIFKGRNSIFHFAANLNNEEIFHLLFKKKPTFEDKTKKNEDEILETINLMDFRNEEDETPFTIALKKFHNSKICGFMLNNGTIFDFSIYTTSIDGKPPKLHEIINKGKLKYFDCLLSLGVSPFIKDDMNNTILHSLFLPITNIEEGEEENEKDEKKFFDFLMKKIGKNYMTNPDFLNLENNQGNTILEICLNIRENMDLCKYLIKILGNNFTNYISKSTGMTILHKLTFNGDHKHLKDILSLQTKPKTAIKDKFDCYPLHYVKDPKCFKILTDKKNKDELNFANKYGYSPLHRFVIEGKTEIIEAMINSVELKKMNFKQRTSSKNENILHLLGRYKNEKIQEMIFENKGISSFFKNQSPILEEKNSAGLTPLDVCIKYSNQDLGEYLIEKRNVNLLIPGKNILLWAVKKRMKRITKAILKNNYQDISSLVKELDEKGKNSLHIAVKQNDVEIVQLLLNHKACEIDAIEKENNSSALMIACENGFDNIALKLLEKNASTKFADKKGRISLHYAATCENVNILKTLIENGSEINKVDMDGKTPLHEAASSNNKFAVDYLVDDNANIEAREKNGRTPLHIAVLTGSTESTKALLEKKADLNAQDKFGDTPFLLASKTGQSECGKLIVCFAKRNS